MTAVTNSSPVFVQQSFTWMDNDSDNPSVHRTSSSRNGVARGSHGGSALLDRSVERERDLESRLDAMEAELATSDSVQQHSTHLAETSPRNARRNTPRMTVPRVETTTPQRRGRCEHVGGIMGAVLERYGISVEQFLAELANQQAQ